MRREEKKTVQTKTKQFLFFFFYFKLMNDLNKMFFINILNSLRFHRIYGFDSFSAVGFLTSIVFFFFVFVALVYLKMRLTFSIDVVGL